MSCFESLIPIQAQSQLLEDYLSRLNGKPDFEIDYLPKLNRLLFGLNRKKLVCITARTSEGKSSLALDLAYNLSNKHNVLYLSLEMTVESAMFRLLCNSKSISNTELYWGNKGLYETQINEFYQEIEERKLIITDSIGRNWQEVLNAMEKLTEDKPDLIFLDWVGLIKTGHNKRNDIDDYVKKFRQLAVEHNLCVVIVQQISRENVKEGHEPSMMGIKESGIFEEASDVVLVLSYPHKRNPNKDIHDYRINVSKNRDGMTAFVDLHFEPSMFKFTEKETPRPQIEVKKPERVDWVN